MDGAAVVGVSVGIEVIGAPPARARVGFAVGVPEFALVTAHDGSHGFSEEQHSDLLFQSTTH